MPQTANGIEWDEPAFQAALKRVEAEGVIDARGARLSSERLHELLDAAPGDHERPGRRQLHKADFRGATFSGDADFGEATFSGEADFGEATFSGDADFSGATFSGFGEPAFRTPILGGASFSRATFSGDADFIGATFSGFADFRGFSVSGGARFQHATFSRDAIFSGATFSGDAYFDWATLGGADFSGATFSGDADFGGATFGATVSTLGSYRGFTVAWAEPGSFSKATFSGDANFSEATFVEDARFDGATFEHARQLGPLLVCGHLLLDRAVFAQPVRIELSSRRLSCARTVFRGGVDVFGCRVARGRRLRRAVTGGRASGDP